MGEQREVRPAIEGQGSLAPTPAPSHEVASFLVQPAMFGGSDLVGRALDQRGKAFAGEPTDCDAPTRGLMAKFSGPTFSSPWVIRLLDLYGRTALELLEISAARRLSY